MLIPRRGVALVGASLMQAKAPAFASVARDGGKGRSLRYVAWRPQEQRPGSCQRLPSKVSTCNELRTPEGKCTRSRPGGWISAVHLPPGDSAWAQRLGVKLITRRVDRSGRRPGCAQAVPASDRKRETCARFYPEPRVLCS